jgi:hypothetical protein
MVQFPEGGDLALAAVVAAATADRRRAARVRRLFLPDPVRPAAAAVIPVVLA